MLVESATMELPDTKTLKLQWPSGYDVDFKTGQFITVYFGDTPSYKRAYSLSSSALDRGFYEITIKRDGKMGTRLVDWAQSGDKLFVIPPAGRFLPVLEPGKHLVCIAGGSGVTPFRAFARKRHNAMPQPKSPSSTASARLSISFSTRSSESSSRRIPTSGSTSPARGWPRRPTGPDGAGASTPNGSMST